jgi:hypothetical protein
MRALVNAEREVAKGNLWRAKEILQGSIPNAGYDCDLFEKLGTVLLMMDDLPGAGRFLFLSGRRKLEYEQAIGIFLVRHRKDWRALFQTFPRVAKLNARSDYPDSVGQQLAEVGCPEVLKSGSTTFSSGHAGSVMPDVVGWLIIGSILVVMLLGIIKVIEIVFWFRYR